MDLQGKVIAALPARSGTSARGEWKAQDFVIETHENYPHKMVFSVFGEERLYNGRWFNSIRAFDVRQIDPATIGAAVPPEAFGAAPAGQAPVAGAQAPFPPQQNAEGESADDLPF